MRSSARPFALARKQSCWQACAGRARRRATAGDWTLPGQPKALATTGASGRTHFARRASPCRSQRGAEGGRGALAKKRRLQGRARARRTAVVCGHGQRRRSRCLEAKHETIRGATDPCGTMISSAPKHHGLMALSVLPGKALFASGGIPEAPPQAGGADRQPWQRTPGAHAWQVEGPSPSPGTPPRRPSPPGEPCCTAGIKAQEGHSPGPRSPRPRAKQGLRRPRGRARPCVASTSPCEGRRGPKARGTVPPEPWVSLGW